MSDPLQGAAWRFAQSQLVRTMVDRLHALIEGRTTRAQVEAWAYAIGLGGDSPVRDHVTAHCVLSSLVRLTEREGDAEIVRVADLRAYLDWLTVGESFHPAPDPLVVLPLSIAELAERTHTVPVRSWWGGWYDELRFCAPAAGRPFAAFTMQAQAGIAIHEQHGDPWRDALIDLFEMLAIDERDVAFLRDDVDLEQLPVWSFWRQDDNVNQFEIERFRSYAKAEAQVQLFTARGHKQFYWVEPAVDQKRSE